MAEGWKGRRSNGKRGGEAKFVKSFKLVKVVCVRVVWHGVAWGGGRGKRADLAAGWVNRGW